MVADGTITQKTFLWHDGLTTWTAAREIPGIFATPAPAPNPVNSTHLNKSSATESHPSRKVFPVPSVKKSSYRLFITSYLIGFLLLAAGILIIYTANSNEASDEAGTGPDFSQIEEVGNPTNNPQPQRKEEHKQTEFNTPTMVGIAILIASGFCFILGGIYSYVILFRAWHVIQAGRARTTPAKAVGFLFVPIFNFYWIFVAYHGWANDWTRIRSSYSNLMAAPRASSGQFLAGCFLIVLFFPVGVFLFFSIISQMCAVSNHMASTYALSRPTTSGLTGTKYY